MRVKITWINKKMEEKMCTQTTRRSCCTSLEHTWEQCLALAILSSVSTCLYSDTNPTTVPWVMTSGKALRICNIAAQAESQRTKEGSELHFSSHIPLACGAVFAARISAKLPVVLLTPYFAQQVGINRNGDSTIFCVFPSICTKKELEG